MALKRTMQPFYGKKEARLEKEISQVQSRMIAAGAGADDISAAIKYGENELAKMRGKRAERHVAHGRNAGRRTQRYARSLTGIGEG
jgi:septal ring factor EnvC (AmiA/AmiB activator)